MNETFHAEPVEDPEPDTSDSLIPIADDKDR